MQVHSEFGHASEPQAVQVYEIPTSLTLQVVEDLANFLFCVWRFVDTQCSRDRVWRTKTSAVGLRAWSVIIAHLGEVPTLTSRWWYFSLKWLPLNRGRQNPVQTKDFPRRNYLSPLKISTKMRLERGTKKIWTPKKFQQDRVYVWLTMVGVLESR